MKQRKWILWLALIVLAIIFIKGRDASPEAPAPTGSSGGNAITALEDVAAQGRAGSSAPDTPPVLETLAPEAGYSYETPDPYAYPARNWEALMPFPSAAQISSVSGLARSPYVSIYPHFPQVDRVLEYSVDLHADHQPRGTYLCPISWWMDVSALEARYASVYNDYTGVPGGYCGFQALEDGSRVFIMTVWSTFCQDHSGHVTVFTPTLLYPEGQGSQNTDSAEGSFTHCILPYDWRIGRDYRVLIQQSRSESSGNTLLTAFVCDLEKDEWTMMMSFDTGVADVYMNSMGGFLENFLPEYAGEVRSMQLSNLRARSADTGRWVSADSTSFLLNGSVSVLSYTGSAAFGTDGAAIWAISSGISGLCPSPSDAGSYPLSPGESGDPY